VREYFGIQLQELNISQENDLFWDELIQDSVRFQVLTAASVRMTAFWDIAPCSITEADCFRSMYCLHHQGKTLVNFYETTWCNIPEGCHLHLFKILFLLLSQIPLLAVSMLSQLSFQAYEMYSEPHNHII
jgi:hypothetical protein